MKSICKFELKLDYEDYINVVDMLGHVTSEDKVYLKLGRLYNFCIHADFTVPNKKNVQILGSNCDLTKFAKIKIINTDTEEVKIINPTKVVNLESGNYKVDYGIWIDNNKETYSTPNFTFRICPEVLYILVDPIVTLVSNNFIEQCENLTGVMFGEPDLYPEGESVFNDSYSHNDVILNSHIEFIGSTYSYGFLPLCPKIRNIYVADNISTFRGCFGTVNSPMKWHNHSVDTFNRSDIKTEIYLGKDVLDALFLALDKIYKCIVSSENPYIEYDSTTHTIIKKELLDGRKVILTGLGWGYPNNTITIPSGYTMGHGYETFAELTSVKTIDMSNFDDTLNHIDYLIHYWYSYLRGIGFDGFRDMYNVETLILPKNVRILPSKYCNGFDKLKNLVIPAEEAPVVVWSGEYGYWGDRANVMIASYTSLVGGTNNSGNTMGTDVPKEDRKLYVLYNGGTSSTSEQLTKKTTWTNDFDLLKDDSWKIDTGETDEQGKPIYTYERPNIWKYVLMKFEDAPETYRNLWKSENTSPCREFTINYLTDQQMADLINNLNPNNN